MFQFSASKIKEGMFPKSIPSAVVLQMVPISVANKIIGDRLQAAKNDINKCDMKADDNPIEEK